MKRLLALTSLSLALTSLAGPGGALLGALANLVALGRLRATEEGLDDPYMASVLMLVASVNGEGMYLVGIKSLFDLIIYEAFCLTLALSAAWYFWSFKKRISSLFSLSVAALPFFRWAPLLALLGLPEAFWKGEGK